MKWSFVLGALAVSLVLPSSLVQRARGDEVPKEFRETIKRGLEWLAKEQKKDGHWGANGDQYPVAMTGLAGVALLMEGSTIREGKYKDNIKRAVDWLMENERTRANGLISNPNHPSEQGRYMYGHGFGMLFLACCYGDEVNKNQREKLKGVLTRAVKFTGEAQSTQGGWYYTSAKDGHDADEGSVTITQLQALRACRNAGIKVPKQIIDKARKYLERATTANGGVVYSLGRGGMGAPVGGERPALTAAAIACGFSAGEYNSAIVKKWFKYCKTAIPIGQVARIGHDEYTHFYYGQALYMLGDKGWNKMFPNDKDGLTWSKYRKDMFKMLKESQNKDGSWNRGGGWSIGTIYSTSVYLTILQLDNATLPIFQR
jgi:rhamnogalacturonyl hydrolase YesR